MTDHEKPLTSAEEALLDYSLGLSSALSDVDANDAAQMRELVVEARRACEASASPVASDRIVQLQAAARAAADPAPPSFWQLLRGELHANIWVRLVAASLVIHLAALPVLAWLHFSPPERPPLWIHFEEPPPVLTSEPQPELLAPIDLEGLLQSSDPTELTGSAPTLVPDK